MAIKGVLVAAGYGSRFLPVTRCVPKEMLPILDRPAIDYVVRELQEAGVRELLVISSRRKRALEDWFDRDPELEAAFAGHPDKLAAIAPPPIEAHIVRQQVMSGTGDALLLAREFAGSDPVIVAYPDDLFGAPNLSVQLVEAHRRTGCSVLSAVDCAGQDLSRYGVLDVVEAAPGEPASESSAGLLRVRALVEKPPAGTEPSSLVSMGRYLYTPEIFDELAAGRRSHRGGEYYHTPAVSSLAAKGRVVAVVARAPRFDLGQPLGFLQAVVSLALERPGVGEPFGAWLRDRVRERS